MIRSATLEFIASKCDEYFIPLEPLTLIEINKVYEFIKTELYKDEITRGIDFEHFQDAFNRTISKTLNRQAFVDSEINAVRNMLGGGLATWYKQSPINQYKIFNDIQKLVLIDKNEYEIFSHYYIKYVIQERSFCKLVSIVHSYGLIKYLCFLEGEPLKTKQPQQNAPPELPEIKPIFNPKYINPIFELLKDYFSKEHQPWLLEIMQNGSIASNRLIFLSNGNRLADAFKQLIKADIITGVQQIELETWIQKNFCYRYRDKVKKFTPRYLNDIISTTKIIPEKNAILNLKQDKTTGKYSIIKA